VQVWSVVSDLLLTGFITSTLSGPTTHLFINAVQVLPAGGVFEQHLVPVYQLVEAEENVVGERVLVPDAVPGDKDVRPLLPGIPRRRDVDGPVPELLLREVLKTRVPWSPSLGVVR
jgi:hypothetical protein